MYWIIGFALCIAACFFLFKSFSSDSEGRAVLLLALFLVLWVFGFFCFVEASTRGS